jgi:hypothetical protein
MLSKKRRQNKDSNNDKFLLKLYEILNDPNNKHIIRWNETGSFIIISDMQELTKNILPIYFSHHNYSSFVRQLNMYDFHKIRNNTDKDEQCFIHEFFNRSRTIKDIKSFERNTNKKDLKLFFFQGDNSNIKYTVMQKKKSDKIRSEDINLIETENGNFESYEKNLKFCQNLNSDSTKKLLLFLVDKNQEIAENCKETQNKLNILNENMQNYTNKINNINMDIENHSVFLAKIKKLYIVLVNMLMKKRKNNEIENKINIINQDKNKIVKQHFINFVQNYIYYHKRNRINLLSKIRFFKNSKIQRGAAFSINEDKYLNKLDLFSLKSSKSNKLGDSFSISGEDKINSSFSMIGNSNNFFDGSPPNQNFFSEQNFITYNNDKNFSNSSYFI